MIDYNEELSPISILSMLDSNKQQRESFVGALIEQLRAGHENPLVVHIKLKNTEQMLKMVADSPEYKAMVLAEAEKLEKGATIHNAKVEIRETGVKYDWSKCGDELLMKKMEELENLQSVIKERQELLKRVPPQGMDYVDENGEVIRIYPPAKSSTTSVIVTLK